jgi:hypothetical protein
MTDDQELRVVGDAPCRHESHSHTVWLGEEMTWMGSFRPEGSRLVHLEPCPATDPDRPAVSGDSVGMTVVKVTLTTEIGPVETFGETTASPYLFITPDVGRDGLITGRWSLTHGPSGRALPTGRWTGDPSKLRALAAKVAHLNHLNWADTNPAATREARAAYTAAIHPTFDDLNPNHSKRTGS